MRRLFTLLLFGGLAWYAWSRSQSAPHPVDPPESVSFEVVDPVRSRLTSPAASGFTCDGRTHCSQMTSCNEARYFLRNCPNVKMDGNNDGEPCESQWCGNAR
jgi:hypothetical protein